MSEKYVPQCGDRVRVVLEGEVDWLSNETDIRLVNTGGYALVFDLKADRRIVSVEKLPDPLPTTPGSVIRNRHSGSTFTVTRDGRVFSHLLNQLLSARIADERAEEFDVLFDAGKVES